MKEGRKDEGGGRVAESCCRSSDGPLTRWSGDPASTESDSQICPIRLDHLDNLSLIRLNRDRPVTDDLIGDEPLLVVGIK